MTKKEEARLNAIAQYEAATTPEQYEAAERALAKTEPLRCEKKNPYWSEVKDKRQRKRNRKPRTSISQAEKDSAAKEAADRLTQLLLAATKGDAGDE